MSGPKIVVFGGCMDGAIVQHDGGKVDELRRIQNPAKRDPGNGSGESYRLVIDRGSPVYIEEKVLEAVQAKRVRVGRPSDEAT